MVTYIQRKQRLAAIRFLLREEISDPHFIRTLELLNVLDVIKSTEFLAILNSWKNNEFDKIKDYLISRIGTE